MPATNELLQQGRYRIIQQFGQDATGAIYEAYDNVTGANVVLRENLVKLRKVTTAAQQESLHLAFAGEARALTEIRHESFQHVRDYFSEIDRQYLVLEAIEGNDLGELVEKNKRPFSLAEVAQWADQMLDALNYLHTHKPPIIHRDIKPRNVKLTAAGRVKILPFGIVRNPDARMNASMANPTTLLYLPLEQIWNSLDSASRKVILNSYDEKSERILEQPADARSDIYGVGATVYYLLTTRPPVDSLTRSIDVLEGKDDPLPTPRQLNPTIPPEVSGVLMKALEIRRENRFDSAVIMRQALRTAFVRVKERESGQAAEQETMMPSVAPDVRLAEQARLAAQRRQIADQERLKFAEQERLKVEAEQKRQAQELAEQKRQTEELAKQKQQAEELARQKRQAEELAQQQLREAEAKKLKAEREAVEAEKVMAAKAAAESSGEQVPAQQSIIQVETPEPSPATKTDNAASGHDSTSKPTPTYSNNDFNVLFAEPKTNSNAWRLPVIAVVLVVIGIVAVAGWVMLKSNTGESNQTIVDPSMAVTDKAQPEPSVETTTAAPIVETTPETTVVESTPPAPEANPIETTVAPTADVKNKPAAAPRVKKQTPTTPTAVKTPASEKKAVTVDDLINDN